jgi:threonine dehydrogenase-like Zn-dependent dehydrogenase
LLAFMYCLSQNPRLLIALDFLDWKLDIAKKCGADIVFNPSGCDVIAEVRLVVSFSFALPEYTSPMYSQVKKLTRGLGCDVYIEATGHPSAVQQGCGDDFNYCDDLNYCVDLSYCGIFPFSHVF